MSKLTKKRLAKMIASNMHLTPRTPNLIRLTGTLSARLY